MQLSVLSRHTFVEAFLLNQQTQYDWEAINGGQEQSWHSHLGPFPGGLFGKRCLLPPILLLSNQPLGIWYSRWALPHTWKITRKCNQCFLHFCMNLVMCSTCKVFVPENIYRSSAVCKGVEIIKVNRDTNDFYKYFADLNIQDLFLTFP